MVMHVGAIGSEKAREAFPMARAVLVGVVQFPWDLFVPQHVATAPPVPAPAAAPKAAAPSAPPQPAPLKHVHRSVPASVPAEILRPGCTAADESLTVLGHLQGLAAGWGGYGVLRTSAERLEHGAMGAERMGDPDTAMAMREFKTRLASVHTPEAAREAARDLVPITQRAWSLGIRCGKAHAGKAEG